MAGTSFKGKPGLNASSAAQKLHTDHSHTDNIFKAFEALEDHCNLLDQKISSLSNQLNALEQSLQKEKEHRELLETELHVSQAITMATYDARSQFLDNMSHEMRTPLNGILGMAQLMLDTPLSPEQRENIEAIQQSGMIMDDLISGLLDYSRLKQNEFPFEQNSFELYTLLEEVIAGLEDRALEKNLELALIPKATTRCKIETDRARLKQIAEILLDNALKFTSEGHVALFAELHRGPKNKGRLNLRIQDTGSGIQEEHLPFIFEPFWQGELSNTRKYGGLGMGLALCQELVIKMDGHIEVIESSEAGTTIEVSLPVNILSKPPELPPLQKTSHAAIADRQSLRAGIFHVSAINQVVLHELLGWHGVEAIARCAADTNKMDLANLDVVICPTGANTCQALQHLITENKACSHTPVFIGLTTQNQPIQPRDRRQFDIFLPTPILYTPLFEALTFALESLQNRKKVAPTHNENGAVNGSDTAKDGHAGMATMQSMEKVLLLDPVKLNQKILSHMLQSLNYEVEIIETQEQLATLAPGTNFKTTLINITLAPEQYGEILPELLASNHLAQGHTFIGIRGKDATEPAEAYTAAGIQQFLSMPTSLDRLKDLLEAKA